MSCKGCVILLMQPAPLTGTATGVRCNAHHIVHLMQPAPLTGTATLTMALYRGCIIKGCNPHPSRGLQLYDCKEKDFDDRTDATRTPHGDCN